MGGALVIRSPIDDKVDAEAAVWLVKIHGQEGEGARRALEDWIAQSPVHADAFQRASEAWAILPRAARSEQEKVETFARRRSRTPVRAAAALAASLVLGLGGLQWLQSSGGAYSTRLGEQKVATLRDGSRIALNTDTRLGVQFDGDRRRIKLNRGEAMFEVAHDADRPFVVIAGDTRVQALGTVFIVRRTADDVIVTLIKGKVAVTQEQGRMAQPAPAALILKPGEKLTGPEEGPIRIEPESVEAATAWRRGQAVFRDTPLGEAVMELNRYGGPPIVVEDPRLATLPISGVFATNAADFAEAAATLHGLRVERQKDALYIRR